jgi:hypothetical protein
MPLLIHFASGRIAAAPAPQTLYHKAWRIADVRSAGVRFMRGCDIEAR